MNEKQGTPHFLRIARALAMSAGVLSVGGLSAGALQGCASTTTNSDAATDTATDTATTSDTVTVADTSTSVDADPCACVCTGNEAPLPDGGMPPPPPNACTNEQIGRCCAAVGPLPPPEMGA